MLLQTTRDIPNRGKLKRASEQLEGKITPLNHIEDNPHSHAQPDPNE